MKQKYTSRNTSVNSSKVPALFNKINWPVVNTKPFDVLDIGCGKYISHLRQFCTVRGMTYLGYDPYNLTKQENDAILDSLKEKKAELVVCCNVLNVIKEKQVRAEIIQKAYDNLKNYGFAYFSVYEGDRTGIGKESKKDCWQENRKIGDYLPEIKNIFDKTEKKSNMIISLKEKK